MSNVDIIHDIIRHGVEAPNWDDIIALISFLRLHEVTHTVCTVPGDGVTAARHSQRVAWAVAGRVACTVTEDVLPAEAFYVTPHGYVLDCNGDPLPMGQS